MRRTLAHYSTVENIDILLGKRKRRTRYTVYIKTPFLKLTKKSETRERDREWRERKLKLLSGFSLLHPYISVFVFLQAILVIISFLCAWAGPTSNLQRGCLDHFFITLGNSSSSEFFVVFQEESELNYANIHRNSGEKSVHLVNYFSDGSFILCFSVSITLELCLLLQ